MIRLHGLHVVFDQSHEQIYSPYDTMFAGLSRFAVALRKHGATVSLNSQPLTEVLSRDNANGHLLVLGPSIMKAYAAEDIDAIMHFLGAGGGVLVLVEHDDLFGNATFQNALTARMGITALSKNPGWSHLTEQWPRCRASQWDIEDIRLYLPAVLELKRPAKPLAKSGTKGEVVAAMAEWGRGTLVVVGDIEILWNGTTNFGIRDSQNQKFMLRIVTLLAGDARSTEEGARGTILFEQSGFGLAANGSPQGLNRFADALREQGYRIEAASSGAGSYEESVLVVIASPLAPIQAAAMLHQMPRLLLLGDGLLDPLGAEPELARALAVKLGTSPANEVYPLNKIAEAFGFRFQATTVVSARDNHLEALAHWSEPSSSFLLRRGTVLEPLSENFPPSFRVLARTAYGTWTAKTFTPKQIFHAANPDPFRPPSDLSVHAGLPVAIASNQVFALGDVDMLTDDLFETMDGQQAFHQIITWLRGDE